MRARLSMPLISVPILPYIDVPDWFLSSGSDFCPRSLVCPRVIVLFWGGGFCPQISGFFSTGNTLPKGYWLVSW